MKKVIVFGTFDGLHNGHISYFRQAKKYGNFLVVIVARTHNAFKIKGKTTSLSQKARLNFVKNVDIVDLAELGGVDDFFQPIKKHDPDVICLGYDQFLPDKIGIKLNKIKRKVVRLKPYYPDKYKSSLLKTDKKVKRGD